MRTTFTTILLLLLFAGNFVLAANNEMGVGIIVGEPTGICAVNKMNDSNSLAAAIAWSLTGNSSLHLHIDDLFHRDDLLALPFYYGGGIRVLLVENSENEDDNRTTHLGIRLPLGVIYQFDPHPIDAFFEVVPVFDLHPDTDFDINAAVGVRYYFY